MFDYDCVVAIDPDWRQLDSQQIELLDRWVAEKAGGLIVIAGPVFTPLWSRGAAAGEDSQLNPIRALYPVSFYSRGSAAIQLGRASAEAAWPLEFTTEGRQAAFLGLEDSPTASEQAWARFPGVYGYQAIKDVKPGAKVYARFSDPEVTSAGEAPVYMAGQFYGGGRVFYLGSGEMWRLRGVEERYFDTLYTKLIRDVSQGRLLRDSSRGLLLVDKDRCSLGDSITVRATLADAQYRPLSVPAVNASIVHERGERLSLILRQITNSEREGMYSGAFTPSREGDYRIDLEIPGVEGELLTRRSARPDSRDRDRTTSAPRRAAQPVSHADPGCLLRGLGCGPGTRRHGAAGGTHPHERPGNVSAWHARPRFPAAAERLAAGDHLWCPVFRVAGAASEPTGMTGRSRPIR